MLELVTLTGKEFDTLLLLVNKNYIRSIPESQVQITQDNNKDCGVVYCLLFTLKGFVYTETIMFLESIAEFANNKMNLGVRYAWNRSIPEFIMSGDEYDARTIEDVLKTVCKYADEFLSSTKDVSYVKNKIDDTIQLDTVYRVYTHKSNPELFTHLIIHRFPACGDKEFYNLSLYNQNAEDITNFQVYSETFNSMDDLLNALNYKLSITNIMKDQFFEFLFHVIFTHKCNTQVELSQKILHSYENRNFQFGFDGFEKPKKRSNPTCNITVTDSSK